VLNMQKDTEVHI